MALDLNDQWYKRYYSTRKDGAAENTRIVSLTRKEKQVDIPVSYR